MSEKYVYADLPRTGLCNMLFPWARAMIYARDNKCKVLAPQWVQVGRIGPWLRGERDKRYYFGQFTNKGYVTGLRRWFALMQRRRVRMFAGMGSYYDDLRGESQYLKDELERITEPSIVARVQSLPERFIGVHIRRGDFASIGLALGEEYYARAIHRALDKMGPLPILVFSDAKEEELRYLSAFDRLRIMPAAPALHDLLALSKASSLVATNGSTFSGWSAFLGGMPTIWSKDGEKPNDNFNDKEVI